MPVLVLLNDRDVVKNHSFSMYTQFPEKKLYFLLPDTHTYVCVLGGKKC